MFRQISEIALDGVSADLQMRIKRHTEATGSAMLDRSPVAPQQGGGNPLRMGETGKNGRAVKPGRVIQEETKINVRPFPPTIGRDMATARRAEPHGDAVVISLAMYRAQRRAVLGLGEHHSHPFALATLSASKASPTTVSRPKYTSLLIAQPTQE